MSLAGTIKPGDWNSVRQAIHKLSYRELGPTAAPTFEGLTINGVTTVGTLTDGTLSINAGSITGAVAGTFSGKLTCSELETTFGDATIEENVVVSDNVGGFELSAGSSGTLDLSYLDALNQALKTTDDVTFRDISARNITASVDISAGSQFLAPVGSAVVPSHSFTSHTNAGMYLDPSGADKLYLVTEGVYRFRVNAAEVRLTVPLNLNGNAITNATNTNWDIAYTHSQDNSQAHSDYLINTGDDETSGILTAAGFTTVGTVTADDYVLAITDSDSGQIIQNSIRIFHTCVPSDQSPTYANIFVGENSGNFTMTNVAAAYHGTGNVGIGANVLDALTTGYYNFAMGTSSGTDITSGYNNILVGHQAGANIIGGHNNFLFGRDCGAFITTGYHNVGIGTNALRGVSGQSGGINKNVAIGSDSGYSITTGVSNIFLGYKSGYRQTTLSNRLIIDNQLRADATTELTNAIIYGVMAALPADQTLRINANLTVSGAATIGDGTNDLLISSIGVVTMEGSAKRDLTLRADLNTEEIRKEGVPEVEQIGAGPFWGYGMPIWNAAAGGDKLDKQQLFFNEVVPGRWDGASDIIFHVLVCLSDAEDAGDTFKFQFSWNQAGETDVVPVTTHDAVDEITVVDGTQYATYGLDFTIDYNADAGDVIVAHDDISGRLRRVDSTGTEVDNEIIVLDWHTHYTVDKMFKAP